MRWAHSITRPRVPISSPITTYGLSRTVFFGYLAGSKSVSARPSDTDTMTSTALEATGSSSAKKNIVGVVVALGAGSLKMLRGCL